MSSGGRSASTVSPMPADLETLQAENLALREELLAARDRLIGMEMELGQALGERSVFERRVASLETTVNSRSWRLASILMTPYRLLRR
jgi:hypothetical protein